MRNFVQMETLTLISSSLSDLNHVARRLLQAGSAYSVWLFEGAMGVGKTTLIKALAEELGVEEAVQSPTFALVNEYRTSSGAPLYHFDFYRLDDEEEAYDIGLEEYLDSGKLCLIEWPEKVSSLWPSTFYRIVIAQQSDGSRRIEAGVQGSAF
jgi:tRNA threonylcarbamoyladenosine biosynthesis protein TsaE